MSGQNFPTHAYTCYTWGNAVIKLHQKISLGFHWARWTILKCIWQFVYWARSYFDKAGKWKHGCYWVDHYQSGNTLEHTKWWTAYRERYRRCSQLHAILVNQSFSFKIRYKILNCIQKHAVWLFGMYCDWEATQKCVNRGDKLYPNCLINPKSSQREIWGLCKSIWSNILLFHCVFLRLP